MKCPNISKTGKFYLDRTSHYLLGKNFPVFGKYEMARTRTCLHNYDCPNPGKFYLVRTMATNPWIRCPKLDKDHLTRSAWYQAYIHCPKLDGVRTIGQIDVSALFQKFIKNKTSYTRPTSPRKPNLYVAANPSKNRGVLNRLPNDFPVFLSTFEYGFAP